MIFVQTPSHVFGRDDEKKMKNKKLISFCFSRRVEDDQREVSQILTVVLGTRRKRMEKAGKETYQNPHSFRICSKHVYD